MNRFFGGILRFVWSWLFFKLVIGLIALVILLYIEEDWRGARTWAATKAKWEAKGESFDPAKFIPPAVPADQNLAALPVFALERDPANTKFPLQLLASVKPETHGGELPKLNATAEEFRSKIAAAYARMFPGKPVPADSVAQFEALYSVVPEILTAAKTRPLFQLEYDNHYQAPIFRGLGLVTTQIALARLIAIHALLALDSNQAATALDDIKLNFRLAQGAGADPTLVGGLVEIGVIAVTRTPIDAGLADHRWTDAQLADLQATLGKLDLMTQFQTTLRAEVATQTVPNLDYFSSTALKGMGNLYASLWPAGWMKITKARVVDSLFDSLPGVDPKSRRVLPDARIRLENEREMVAAKITKFLPWNMMFLIMCPPISRTALQFGQAQAMLDMERIGCALERYRLAHGSLPEKLDDLVPACIDQLPRDIMNGGSYRYEQYPDGLCMLYSVGGNQKDDGGKVIFEYATSTQPALMEGDWVWFTRKSAAK